MNRPGSSTSLSERRVRADGTLLFDMQIGATGLLRVRIEQYWTVADATAYVAALNRLIPISRGICATGGAHILIDLIDGFVQHADVMAQIAQIDEVMLPQARAAFVLSSSLAKLQLKRYRRHANMEFFISAGAAETWVSIGLANDSSAKLDTV